MFTYTGPQRIVTYFPAMTNMGTLMLHTLLPHAGVVVRTAFRMYTDWKRS